MVLSPHFLYLLAKRSSWSGHKGVRHLCVFISDMMCAKVRNNLEIIHNPKEKVTMFNEIPTATLQRYNATEGCQRYWNEGWK